MRTIRNEIEMCVECVCYEDRSQELERRKKKVHRQEGRRGRQDGGDNTRTWEAGEGKAACACGRLTDRIGRLGNKRRGREGENHAREE